MSNAFLRSKKIKSISDFNRILREKSNIFPSEFFNIYFTRSQISNSRLGIIISKRSLRRAVDRNKVKRVIRETFRKAFKEDLPVALIIVLFENFLMHNKLEFINHLKKSLHFLHNTKFL